MLKCVIIDDDALMRRVLKELVARREDLSLIAEFDNALDSIEFLKKNQADLLLLDIEMPNMTGMEFLEVFNSTLPFVIITTSHENFAPKAFQYNVSGYLVKPINVTEFQKAVEKVIKQINTSITKKNDELFFVKKGSTIKKLNLNDIVLIECIGDYVNIYTDGEKYTVHSTMKEMELKMNHPMFLRVHRSFIVRLDRIEEIEDDSISFGKKIVPIGKTYRQEVYSKLNML